MRIPERRKCCEIAGDSPSAGGEGRVKGDDEFPAHDIMSNPEIYPGISGYIRAQPAIEIMSEPPKGKIGRRPRASGNRSAAGGFITEVAGTLAGNADTGAVNVWCAWV